MTDKPSPGRGGAAPAPPEPTVLHSRSLADLDQMQAHLLESDGQVADLFLRFVQETSGLLSDPEALFPVLSRFTFEAFPQATHFVLVLRDAPDGELRPLLVRDREGGQPDVALSRTLARQVMDDGVAVLYCRGETPIGTTDSIRLSKIDAAICAPLCSRGETIGLLQLDIRHPGKGVFGRKEVDRLAVFAHHMALVLDNLSLREQQREAFASTIGALVHSLSLKDPEAARHSERVQAVAVRLGRALGIGGAELEALRVAAILHDMGKQGIRDEILFKPARLLPGEQEEMERHTEHTVDIVAKIRFPSHLRAVPQIAAYHHEKMDGSGPFGIPGERIPLPSRVISVADVFDALVSARVYKDPMPVAQVLAILEQGRGTDWDGAVIDALGRDLPEILTEIYHTTMEEAGARPWVDDERRRAA